MNHLTPHLELMIEKEASDLFLTANSPVKIKIDGKIISVGKKVLSPDITKKIAQEVKIPVISSGGAGNYEHMYEVLSIKGVEGAAAASIFHFTEQTPLEAKAYLKKKGIIVRAKSK